jgi:glycosyltransferase involved in cell wall biosynthesis
MIWLDVTGGCRLPLQTGIPRTTRELYKLLLDRTSGLVPVAWQPFTANYTRLSPKAAGLLHNPFAHGRYNLKPPSDSTFPILGAALADALRFSSPKVNAERMCAKGSTLLITSIFPDNRLDYLLKLKGRSGRRIAVFHDAIPLGDGAVRGWIRGRHVKALEVFSSMDAVICVSKTSEEALKSLWAGHRMTPTVTHVLPWPVPLGGARPPWSVPPEGIPSILCVGRLKRLKNQTVLLEAAEILWREGLEFSLDLIGCEDVPAESRAMLKTVEKLEREGRPVRWRGHVSDEDLHQCYRGALFTVFPSLEEGMGLPILESFWHGRAVICGLNEPMVSVGRGPGCLHADMRSAPALAEAMRNLIKDRALALSEATSAHGRTLKTWDDYWKELLPIL